MEDAYKYGKKSELIIGIDNLELLFDGKESTNGV